MISSSAPNEAPPPAASGGMPPGTGGRMHWIFFGPGGLRVPWRLVIAISLFCAILTLLFLPVLAIPALRASVPHGKVKVITPGMVLLTESLQAAAILVTALIMSAIEKRPFADYGAPPREAFGKRFWQGIPFGFALLTLLIGPIYLLHGFSLGAVALGRAAAVRFGILYFVGFVLVGIFEEFSFRGYFQATLGSAIGFWSAALILAVVFGAEHLGNSGEAAFGALTAGIYGLVCAFSLRRTGNLWFAIGMHASWDWGETYFYSVPDSGIQATGHLFHSSFHGPNWLTGGTVGPEGSILVLFVLALAALAIHLLFPARRAAS